MSEPPSDVPGRRAVIMAGGRGTRLAPYTTILPKPLLPIDGMPILEIILRQLRRCGFVRTTLCVGYLGELIRTFFGAGERHGMTISYVFDGEPRGTAGPLRLLGDVHEPLLVMNGDLLTSLDYAALYRSHQASGAAMTMATCQRPHQISLGVLHFDEQRRLQRFEEKPCRVDWVCMGIYVIEPWAIEQIPAVGPYGVDELAQALLAAGRTPRVHPFEGIWFDLACPDDYDAAAKCFEEQRDLLLPRAGAWPEGHRGG